MIWSACDSDLFLIFVVRTVRRSIRFHDRPSHRLWKNHNDLPRMPSRPFWRNHKNDRPSRRGGTNSNAQSTSCGGLSRKTQKVRNRCVQQLELSPSQHFGQLANSAMFWKQTEHDDAAKSDRRLALHGQPQHQVRRKSMNNA